jgi:hypothetical protein
MFYDDYDARVPAEQPANRGANAGYAPKDLSSEEEWLISCLEALITIANAATHYVATGNNEYLIGDTGAVFDCANMGEEAVERIKNLLRHPNFNLKVFE